MPTKPDQNEEADLKENMIKLIAGPSENIFLSADILVDSAREVVYDAEANTLVEKDKPTDFYLGVNYSKGDLLSNHKALSSDRLFGKVMLKIGKDPLESYGFGIGFRPKFLEGSSGFVAYVVSKEDTFENGVLIEGGGKSEEVRIGISLNLERALDWLK